MIVLIFYILNILSSFSLLHVFLGFIVSLCFYIFFQIRISFAQAEILLPEGQVYMSRFDLHLHCASLQWSCGLSEWSLRRGRLSYVCVISIFSSVGVSVLKNAFLKSFLFCHNYVLRGIWNLFFVTLSPCYFLLWHYRLGNAQPVFTTNGSAMMALALPKNFAAMAILTVPRISPMSGIAVVRVWGY